MHLGALPDGRATAPETAGRFTPLPLSETGPMRNRERVSMSDRLLTPSCFAFGSECRRLHTHPATSVTASMAPVPVAVTIVAAFHPVIVARLHLVIILAPVPPAIVILSAHRQPDYGENH